MPKKQTKASNDGGTTLVFENPTDLGSQLSSEEIDERMGEYDEREGSDKDKKSDGDLDSSPKKSLAEIFADLYLLQTETERLVFEFNQSQTSEEDELSEEGDVSEKQTVGIPNLTPEELKQLKTVHWELAIKAVTGGDKETLAAVLNPKLQITEIKQEHTQLQIQLNEIQHSVMFIQRQSELLKEFADTDKTEDLKNHYQSQINGAVDYVIHTMRAKYVDYYRHQKLDIEVVSNEGEELRIKEKLLTDERREKLVEQRVAQLSERLATITISLDLTDTREKIGQAIETLNHEERELLDHEKAYLEGIEKLTKRMSYLFFSSNSAYLSILRKEGTTERLPKVVQDALRDEKLETFEQIKQACPCLVSPSAKTSSGNNLLHLALACHQTEIAIILLRYGVSPIERNESGAVPLIIAIDDENYRFVDEALDILRARKLITSKEYDQNYMDVIHRKAEQQEEESDLKRQFKELWNDYHENNEAQEAMKRLKKVVKGMRVEVIERRKALYEYGMRVLGKAEVMGHDTKIVEFAERLSYEEQYRGKQRLHLLTKAEARKLDELVRKSRAVDDFAKLGQVQEQAVMAIKAIVDSVETTMALRVQLSEEMAEYQTDIQKEREKLQKEIQAVTERKDKIIAEKDAEIAEIREKSALEGQEKDKQILVHENFILSQTVELEMSRKETAKAREESAKSRAETAKAWEKAANADKRAANADKKAEESKAETADLKEQFNQMQRMMMAMMRGANPQQAEVSRQKQDGDESSGDEMEDYAIWESLDSQIRFFKPEPLSTQPGRTPSAKQKPNSTKEPDPKGKRKSGMRPKK